MTDEATPKPQTTQLPRVPQKSPEELAAVAEKDAYGAEVALIAAGVQLGRTLGLVPPEGKKLEDLLKAPQTPQSDVAIASLCAAAVQYVGTRAFAVCTRARAAKLFSIATLFEKALEPVRHMLKDHVALVQNGLAKLAPSTPVEATKGEAPEVVVQAIGPDGKPVDLSTLTTKGAA